MCCGYAVPAFDVQFKSAVITGTQYTMSSGDTETYSISLNYEAITFTYYQYNSAGTQTGKSVVTYDFPKNKAS